MPNTSTLSDAWQKYLDIADDLGKKEFGIVLRCPECGGAIENFTCSQCVCKLKQSTKGATTAFAFGVLFCYLMPFLFGGIGYCINGRVGLIIGFFIGLGMGRMGREMEKQGYQSDKAKVAPDFLLAERYVKKSGFDDMAAFCYFHWLRTQSFPKPPEGMTMFLWRYRCATSVNIDLRQSFLDMFFHKMAYIIEAQKSIGSVSRANLMLAIANDSPTQIEIARIIFRCCSWRTELSELLSDAAPLTAAALLGEKSPVMDGDYEKPPVVVRALGEPTFWQHKSLEFDIPPEEYKKLKFLYRCGKRMIGVTADRILVGTAEFDTKRIRVTFSEPLANIERVCEEWSAQGREYRALWFFAADHAYSFSGVPSLGQALVVAGAIPVNMPVTPVRAKVILARASVGNIVCGVFTLVFLIGIVIILVGKNTVYGKESLVSAGLLISILTFIPMLVSMIVALSDGLNGSRATFLEACGLKKVRDFVDHQTPLPK